MKLAVDVNEGDESGGDGSEGGGMKLKVDG